MGALVLVLPGDLDTLTGGYAYDRRVVSGLRERGWTVDVRELDGSFPRPTVAALEQAAQVFARIPDGATVLVDGLAFGAMPALAEREGERLRLIALVHHPLAAETGVDAASAAALEADERRALACARQVIVTSHATAAMLATYNVPHDRIVVVEPGTDRQVGRVLSDPARAARSVGRLLSDPPAFRSVGRVLSDPAAQAGPEDPPYIRLLCVASLIPRKGHEILFRALALLKDRQWRLTCVGSFDRDPATVARLRAQLRDDGLEAFVTLAGELSGAALHAEYDRADLFVLPTFHEGYGMAVAEALAHGVPVISTPTGGIETLIGADPCAGLLVPPGDANALASALTRVLADAMLREQLAGGAKRARDRLPTWDTAVEKIAAALSAWSDTFSASWLALREPADAAARSTALTRALVEALPPARPLRILDLGAGTGANVRYLISRLPGPQRWLLVDRDASLLARAAQQIPSATTSVADLVGLVARPFPASANAAARLAEAPEARRRQGRDDDPFSNRDLVTASALLDLVSESWLRALAERCRANGAAVLFALSYDGRIQCSPEEPEDALVRDLVNRHQRTDKGFGPALGPEATDVAARCFADLGYSIKRESSDWVLTPESRELQQQVIDGWARAAAEVEPLRAKTIEAWRMRRLAHVAAGRSRLIVGHEDLAAWLSGGSERTRPTDVDA